MHRIIRTKRSGQILGLLFFLVGVTFLLMVFWKAWLNIPPASDTLSALWSYILAEDFDLAGLITLKLSYLLLTGGILLSLSLIVLALSRQIFYVSGGSVSLKCPYCRNSWRARRAMGWAECPFCRKFIQPTVTKKYN